MFSLSKLITAFLKVNMFYHRNIKTQGKTTAEFSLIKLDGFYGRVRARNLVVSDLRSETKGSRFESGC